MRWVLATLVVVTLLAVPGSHVALAFQCKHSKSYDYVFLHWDSREVHYGIREGTPVEVSAVATSFGVWSAQPCTDVRFVYEGEVPEARKDVCQVLYVTQGWADRKVNEGDSQREHSVIALTITTYSVETGTIRVANIEMNAEDYTFEDVNEDPVCTSATTMDFGSVLTHEVGHLLGLDHTQAENVHNQGDDPTMATTIGGCQSDKRSLEKDDVEGLCLLYPSGEPTGHCEKNLPAQDPGDITSPPFGCATDSPVGKGSGRFSPPVWAAILTLGGLWFLRRRGPPPAQPRC